MEIDPTSKIASNATILQGVRLGKNVEVRDYCKLICVSVSDNSVVDVGALLLGVQKSKFSIGKESYIGYYAVLDGCGGLEIGDYVHISTVGIWTHTTAHQALLGEKLRGSTHRKEAPVKIESNVWIGGSTTIYPGISIGHHSIILPNTSVNNDVPPYSMVGGSPAKLIKRIEISKNKVSYISVKEK